MIDWVVLDTEIIDNGETEGKSIGISKMFGKFANVNLTLVHEKKNETKHKGDNENLIGN